MLLVPSFTKKSGYQSDSLIVDLFRLTDNESDIDLTWPLDVAGCRDKYSFQVTTTRLRRHCRSADDQNGKELPGWKGCKSFVLQKASNVSLIVFLFFGK